MSSRPTETTRSKRARERAPVIVAWPRSASDASGRRPRRRAREPIGDRVAAAEIERAARRAGSPDRQPVEQFVDRAADAGSANRLVRAARAAAGGAEARSKGRSDRGRGPSRRYSRPRRAATGPTRLSDAGHFVRYRTVDGRRCRPSLRAARGTALAALTATCLRDSPLWPARPSR